MTIDEAKVKIRELWAKRISREDAQAYVSTMSLDGEEVDVREFVDRLWQEKPENNPARNLTDLGNAELIVEKYRGLIHYSWERHLWLTWNGKNWEWDDGNRIVEYAIQTVRCIYSEAADEINKDDREKIAKHAIKSESDSRIKAMVSLARALPDIPIKLSELDAHPWLFNVNNGTINLRTGQLQPHNSAELHSILVPIDFDPNAACPLWDSFLKRVLAGDNELIRYVQRAVGYTLTADTRLQVFFFLYGCGNNGKSTFLSQSQTANLLDNFLLCC